MNTFARKGFVTALTFVAIVGQLAVLPATAEASVLYVRTVDGCSDSGSGTNEQPFCTAQAAADVVLPGQTVKMDGSVLGGLTVTRSGTEAAPIVFEGGRAHSGMNDARPALVVRGAHDVVFRGTNVVYGSRETGPGLRVTQASRVTFDRLSVATDGPGRYAGGGILIDEGSSMVTISRSTLSIGRTAIEVRGSADVTIAGNLIEEINGGIELTDAPRAAIAGNTVKRSCNRSIAVFGDAAGTSIQNNVLDGLTAREYYSICPPLTEDRQHHIVVDAAAAPGVTTDYNLLNPLAAYSWAGVTRWTSKELHTATGQAARDVNTTFGTGEWIDSANADAPGQLPTDRLGTGPVDHPKKANTGVGKVPYQERGAWELADRVSGVLIVSATKAPVGGQVTVEGKYSSSWALPIACDIDFGDGTKADTCSTTHAYATAGKYTITVAATTAGGSRTDIRDIQIVDAVGTLTPTVTATPSALMTADLTVDAGTTPWNIAETTFEFDDGTPAYTVRGGEGRHRFPRPGIHPVRAKVTDAGGNTATAETTFATLGSGLAPLAPTRVLDTRAGTGAPAKRVEPRATLRLGVAGQGAIPADVTAVAVNVTVTEPTAGGFITVFPAGVDRPLASTLNFVPGQTVPNLAIIPVGANGAIDFHNGSSGTVQLIADVTAYYSKQPDSHGYEATTPNRVLDSRLGNGTPTGKAGALSANGTWSQKLAGLTLPADATSVMLNVTVTNPAAGGYLTVFPAGGAKPLASNLNYVAGQTVANAVLVPVGADGAVSYYSTSRTDVIVDVVGYAGASGGNFFAPLTPTRVVDTRVGTGQDHTSPLGPRWKADFELLPAGVAPTFAAIAVFNATVVNPRASGFLTAFPTSGSMPTASTLNFTAGATVPNLAVVRDFVSFHNGSDGSTDLVVDVTGYLSYS